MSWQYSLGERGVRLFQSLLLADIIAIDIYIYILGDVATYDLSIFYSI